MIRIIPLFLFCIAAINSFAQIQISPLQYDPARYTTPGRNLRIAAAADTTPLSLPFFEDFTSPNASIDSIYFLPDGSLQITTLGKHGLQDQDQIYLTFDDNDALYLNGSYYIKNTGKFSFILYLDKGLSMPQNYTSVPDTRYHGYWRRPGAKIGPNPDTLKWVNNGGTFINNTLCNNPPSLYVASFDGLTANGSPYAYNSTNGLIDNLTSLPIDLSGLTKDSNVVLNFYWQCGGFGFFPNRSDSLYLLFKDSTGAWDYVWGKNTKSTKFLIDSSIFYKVTLNIDSGAYFHSGFQFRFQAAGFRGGAGDNWNLDYIYLDKQWDNFKEYPNDRAFSKSQSPLLKRYTSMPYDQFIANPDNELSDTVGFTIKNLSQDIILIDFDQKYMYGATGKTVPLPIASFNQILAADTLPHYYHWNMVDKSNFNFSGDSLVVKYLVSVQTSDPDKKNGVDFTTNNIDSAQTLFQNYFAYDDGTAEATGNNPQGGPLLIKYTLNSLPDTITAIDIYVSKTYTYNNSDYSQFSLLLADSGKATIATVSYSPSYSGRDNFIRVPLPSGYKAINTPVFYVGYSNPYADETINIPIPIGMDFTLPQRQQVFYKNSGDFVWSEYKGGGNFMIRPVFGNIPVTGVFGPTYAELTSEIFPNPASGPVYIKGEVANAELYDISGKLLTAIAFSPSETTKKMDVSAFENGFYFLHLMNEDLESVKKLVIAR
jgi:hypothetical protein